MQPSLTLILLVVFGIPLAWTGALSGLRKIFGGKADIPDDRAEKRHLLLLGLPAVVGVVVAVAGRFAPVSMALPIIAEGDIGPVVVAALPQGSQPHLVIDWGQGLAVAACALYGVGVAWYGARLALAWIRLGRTVAMATPTEAWGEGVRVTRASLPPLAWGQSTVLLPQVLLDHLSPAQVRLIVAHEREHLRRGDTAAFTCFAVIDAVFWFNPFIRRQTRICRAAAEVACDAGVVRALPEQRHSYAETLIRTLRLNLGDMGGAVPAMAFLAEYRLRLTQILQPAQQGRSRLWLFFAGVILIVPVAFAQFAWSQSPAVVGAPRMMHTPIDLPLTSTYGRRTDPFGGQMAFHQGVDFTAPVGTPVYAAADGRVTVAKFLPGFGEVVEIDHGGDLKTRYAHLDHAVVTVGAAVTAGQVVALSGNTGKTTGPHLHFEVWQAGHTVDPSAFLPAGAAPAP